MKHDIREAYLAMAKVGYRPAAPGDGCGSISLTRKQLADPAQLEREATGYADSFRKEEDTCRFWIGCADSRRTQALVYTIEAARFALWLCPPRPELDSSLCGQVAQNGIGTD